MFNPTLKFFRNSIFNPFYIVARTQCNLVTAAIIGGVASLAGSAMSANAASKAAARAADAAKIDINALDAQTRAMARRNALESAELERVLTPEVANLRTQSTQGVLDNLGDSPEQRAATEALMARLGQPVAGKAMSPLLQDAIAKAKADLALGGGLDTETKNLVTSRALANAGSNTSNLGLGRDISARDLGLTSLQLQNQRLANASQLGGQELGMEQFNVGTDFNNAANLLNQIQLLRGMGDNRFNRNLAAAQFSQGIAQPVVGLDPSSVANIYAGNASNASAALSNQANIKGAQGQGMSQLGGNLLGYGLLSYNNPGSGSTPNYGGTLQPGKGW